MSDQKSKQKVLELCGDRTFLLPKNSQQKMNLTRFIQQLENENINILKHGSLGVTFEYQSKEGIKVIISIFNNGNTLVRGESNTDKIIQISREINSRFNLE